MLLVSSFKRLWTVHIAGNVKTLWMCVAEFIRRHIFSNSNLSSIKPISHTSSSSNQEVTESNTAKPSERNDTSSSNQEVTELRSVERVYRLNDKGRVLKRSLRLDECPLRDNGEPFIAPLIVERLKNEAACMKFIREHTDIPVPRVLDTYEENGSYHLWMEYIDGSVEMSELSKEQQSEVCQQGTWFILLGFRSTGHEHQLF